MNSNLFWCIVGALFSLLISFVFFFIGQKRKQISYYIATSRLISNKINQINGLEIKYLSKDMKNLYYSTIRIKNIGNSIIEGQDFSSTFPISFYTNGEFLINISEEYAVSTKINQSPITYIGVSGNNTNICNIVKLNFEYFSKKQELSFTLFHTDTIIFKGILKDGKIINEVTLSRRRIKLQYILDRLKYVFIFISGIMSGLAFSYIYNYFYR